jgi:hypothetical protein
MPIEKDGPLRSLSSHKATAVGVMKSAEAIQVSEIRWWRTTTTNAENHAALSRSAAPRETHMANTRPSQRQLAETKNAVRHEEMERAVADGRLVIRSMTALEREQSDSRWAAAAKARDHRAKRRQHA